KPENIKLKKDFEEANKKEGAAERKSAIMKTVEDFEKEEKARAKREKEKDKSEGSKEEKVGGKKEGEEIKSGVKKKEKTSSASSTSDKEVLKKMDNISRNTEETKHQLINMNKSVTSLIDSMRNKNTKTSADIPEEYVGTSSSLRNRQMYKRNEKGEFMNLNEEQKAQSKQQRETLNKKTETTAPETKNTLDQAA
ncbi:MAG: hypothetical protein PHQ01_04555, partial [Candidatus Pacebacteria bacterium]|nr:hypothetical protein [Candidatus Paceibacterota bacterium]